MIGATIGNYVIRALIGQGGMGSVYLGEHVTLGRRAAIKVLLPEMSADQKIVARFFNEAKAATAVRHPGIVEIYDFGTTAEGAAYIVMEMLEGETLSARRRRQGGRIDPRRAMLIARQIAGALSAAHDAGIVHRDLKPDNIFLVPDLDVQVGERVKILDFGIAKLQRGADDMSRTRTGAVMGTPTYMSPEQCRGSGDVDARADLYALGCVLYELLVGRPPFAADGPGDMIAHHLYFAPQQLRTVDDTIPDQIERVVMWLLQKEPAHRPPHARVLIEAIDRLGLGTGDFSHVPSQPTIPAPAANAPTTLSGASGVKTPAPGTNPQLAPRRRWLVPVVAIGTAGIGIAAIMALSSSAPKAASQSTTASPAPSPPPPPSPSPSPSPSPTPTPTPTPPPPPVAHVTLTLETDPPGATVLVGTKKLGETPFSDDLERHARGRTYTLQKDGYEPATVTLDAERDVTRKLVLVKKKKKPVTHTPPGLGNGGVNPFE